MIGAFLWLLAGLLLGAIVHLTTILSLPYLAPNTAYVRLQALAPINTATPLPEAAAEAASLPFADPAFASAVCLYDLSNGPLRISTALSPWYTSLSFYSPFGMAYYALNDRAGSNRRIELTLATAAQRARLPTDEETTRADRLVVESPTEQGIVLYRALAPEPGAMPLARGALSTARCEPAPER